MKKILALIVVSVLCAVVSPSVIHALVTSRLQVKDRITGELIPGARVNMSYYTYSVNCTLSNYLGSLNAVTDSRGEIVLDGIFNATVQNIILAGYTVQKDGYESTNHIIDRRTIWINELSTINLNPLNYCGNGFCNPPENLQNCPQDCHVCGDGVCSAPWENQFNCANDCANYPNCGNGICEPQYGENPQTCPVDCRGPICGNGICERNLGENERNCRIDCRIKFDDQTKPGVLKLKTVK